MELGRQYGACANKLPADGLPHRDVFYAQLGAATRPKPGRGGKGRVPRKNATTAPLFLSFHRRISIDSSPSSPNTMHHFDSRTVSRQLPGCAAEIFVHDIACPIACVFTVAAIGRVEEKIFGIVTSNISAIHPRAQQFPLFSVTLSQVLLLLPLLCYSKCSFFVTLNGCSLSGSAR